MEFTVNWIIFSAVAIAVGTSIETRKWSPIFIFICCVLFSLFSSWHDVLMALTLCSFFRLNGPIQRMQLDSDWIYVNANRKRSFNFAFILNCFQFRQSNWPKSREFIQNRKKNQIQTRRVDVCATNAKPKWKKLFIFHIMQRRNDWYACNVKCNAITTDTQRHHMRIHHSVQHRLWQWHSHSYSHRYECNLL